MLYSQLLQCSAEFQLQFCRPLLCGIQIYGCLCTFINKASNSRSKSASNFSIRSFKLGPVEAGEVRTAGSDGGGGHDTATGTVVTPAQPLNNSAIASVQTLVGFICFLLSLSISQYLSLTFEFCHLSFRLHPGLECFSRRLASSQTHPLKLPSYPTTQHESRNRYSTKQVQLGYHPALLVHPVCTCFGYVRTHFRYIHADLGYAHPLPSHIVRSAARRFTSPRKTLPPALFQRLISAQAPA